MRAIYHSNTRCRPSRTRHQLSAQRRTKQQRRCQNWLRSGTSFSCVTHALRTTTPIMTSVTETPTKVENSTKKRLAAGNYCHMGAVLGITLGILLAYFAVRLASGQPLIGPPASTASSCNRHSHAQFHTDGAYWEKVSLNDYRDKVVLLYFGYTFCPDVCPATMWELSKLSADCLQSSRIRCRC